MKAYRGKTVSVCTRLHVPIQLAWQALYNVLDDLEGHPGMASLQLSLPGSFDAHISVPIRISTSKGNSQYELTVSIEAVAQTRLFPAFHGVIWLVHSLANACDLRLEGIYRVPLSGVGAAIDMTLLRDAAGVSLKHFVDELAQSVTARVRIVS